MIERYEWVASYIRPYWRQIFSDVFILFCSSEEARLDHMKKPS